MNKYELIYIISVDTAEEKREAIISRFNSYVQEKGGNVENLDKMGVKKLAYPIKFKNEGYYVYMRVALPMNEVDAMSKLLNITDGVIRHQFVRV